MPAYVRVLSVVGDLYRHGIVGLPFALKGRLCRIVIERMQDVLLS